MPLARIEIASAIVEFRIDVDRPPGPPIEARLPREEVRDVLVRNGFDVVDGATVGPYRYFVMGRRSR